MAGNKDFEGRYFDQMDENFKSLKDDIKGIKNDTQKISSHLQKVNGRLAKVEHKVFPDVPQTIQQLPPIWRDPQVIKLATITAIGVIIVLVIFAGLRGIPLPKGIF